MQPYAPFSDNNQGYSPPKAPYTAHYQEKETTSDK